MATRFELNLKRAINPGALDDFAFNQAGWRDNLAG
jgi:hypothetical protein